METLILVGLSTWWHKQEGSVDFFDLNKAINKWSQFKSTYRDMAWIQDDLKGKSEADQTQYLNEINAFLGDINPEKSHRLLVRIETRIEKELFYENESVKKTNNWWLTKTKKQVAEMLAFNEQFNQQYKPLIPTASKGSANHRVLYENVRKAINWKGKPEEFTRQMEALTAAGYIAVIDNHITFIHGDALKMS